MSLPHSVPERDPRGGGAPESVDRAIAAKVRPPPLRPGIVPRTALVDRMLAEQFGSVVSLVAPPGYGKTSVLIQWSKQQEHDLAWVSLDGGDNDPAALLAAAATSLNQVVPMDPDLAAALRSPTASVATTTSRLVSALWSMERSVALVLDHVEAVDDQAALDVIGQLAVQLPAGVRLAVASRREPPVAAALQRSRGNLVEIGIGDLAMDQREAQLLFEAAHVDTSAIDVADLVDKTEGWPVGLYLAALAANAGGRPGPRVAFRGDDRLMADYLRAEILARLSPDLVSFLTRTSVLDELCGPLCDATLDTRGSHAVLESLETSNLLVVPLDRHREWYRYHRLFRELLAAELHRNEPELERELHLRAAAWLEADGQPEAAIGHGQAARDLPRVARLVTAMTQPTYAVGRVATVRHWLDWCHAEGIVEQYPQLAILGGLVESLRGQPARAERWARAAERGNDGPPPDRGALPDGSPIVGWTAFLNALSCRRGVAEMRADAREAQDLLGPHSPFRGGARLLEGISHVLDGDDATGDRILAHAVDVARDLGAMPAATAALGYRALLAVGRDDWDAAQALCEQALDIIETAHLDDNLESTLALVVAARIATHRAEPNAAKEYVARAARLRPVLTYAIPLTAQFQLELARAYLELADASGARAVLREFRDTLQQRPDLGVLPAEGERLQAALDHARQTSIGASALTRAELRLVPLLATHLSFREIAERLHVSRHTVKTQAISVYRKLGVSSRSEAVERMDEIGLRAI